MSLFSFNSATTMDNDLITFDSMATLDNDYQVNWSYKYSRIGMTYEDYFYTDGFMRYIYRNAYLQKSDYSPQNFSEDLVYHHLFLHEYGYVPNRRNGVLIPFAEYSGQLQNLAYLQHVYAEINYLFGEHYTAAPILRYIPLTELKNVLHSPFFLELENDMLENQEIFQGISKRVMKVLCKDLGRDVRYLFALLRVPRTNIKRRLKFLENAVKQGETTSSNITGMSVNGISGTLINTLKSTVLTQIEEYLGISLSTVKAFAWTLIVSCSVSFLTTLGDIIVRGASILLITSLVSSIISLVIAIINAVAIHSLDTASLWEDFFSKMAPLLSDQFFTFFKSINASSGKCFEEPSNFKPRPFNTHLENISQPVIKEWEPTQQQHECVGEFDIVNVPGDGECLYYCLWKMAKDQGKTNTLSVPAFKRQLLRYIKNDIQAPEVFHDLIPSLGIDKKHPKFSKEHWGNSMTIEAAAYYYNMCFCVHTKFEGKDITLSFAPKGVSQHIVGHMQLNGQHYNILNPKELQSGSDIANVAISATVGMVATGMTIAGVSGWKGGVDFMKNFNIASTFKKNLADNVSSVREIVENVSEVAFDCVLSSKSHYIKDVGMLVVQLDDFLMMDPVVFQLDILQFYDFRDAILRGNTLLTSCRTSTSDARIISASQLLQTSLARSKLRLKQISDALRTQGVRQETMLVHLYGAPGAGKTHFVQRYLIPKLCEEMGWDHNYYTIAFGGQDKYWPIYNGAKIGLVDEFLAQKEEDPLIPHLNGIASQTFFNMPHAELEHKYQPCALKVLFLISNAGWTNLKNKLDPGAEHAFYSRMHTYEVVNTSLQKGMIRDSITHSDNYGELKFKRYDKVMGSDFQAFTEGDGFTYVTKDNIISEIKTKVDKFTTSYQEVEKPAIVLNYSVKQSAIADNLAFFFSGEPGTGKSVLTDYVARQLSTITKMPLLIIRNQKLGDIQPYTVPAIYVLHDHVYDEKAYLHFYDSVAKPSIILNSANLKITKERTFSPTHAWQVSATKLDFLTNYLYDLGCKRYAICPLTQINQQPGFIRRLGITGPMTHCGQTSFRPHDMGGHITAHLGYIFKDQNGKHLTRDMVLDKIFQQVNKVLKSSGKITYQQVDTLEQTITPTISLITDGMEQLCEVVNDQTKILRAFLNGKQNNPKTPYILVDPDLANSSFNFTPSMFHIPSISTRDELIELAERSYATLRTGDPKFSCWIDTQEVRVWAYDNVIQYTLDKEISVMYHEIKDDVYTLYRMEENGTIKILTQWDLQALVYALENGFVGEEYVGISVDYIQYAISNYATISRHERYRHYLPNIKIQTISAQILKSETLDFWVSFKEFTRSPTFIVLTVLCGIILLLLLCKAIYSFIRMFMKQDKKELITAQVYDENTQRTLQAVAVPLMNYRPCDEENWPHDWQAMQGRPSQDGSAMYYDVYVSTNDLISYYKSTHGPYSEVMNLLTCIFHEKGVQNILSINVDIDFPQFVKELSPDFEIERQAGDYTKPTKISKGKNVTRTKAIRTPPVRIAPINNQSADIQRHVVQQFKNNSVQVTAQKKSFGIAIKQNFIICPAHLFEVEDGETVLPIYVERLFKGQLMQFPATIVSIDYQGDVALLSVDSKQYPYVPDITGYFVDMNGVDKVHKGFIAVWRSLWISQIDQHHGHMTYGDYCSFVDGKVVRDKKLIFSNWYGGFRTIEGDCGLPYFADDKSLNEKICLGFHIAKRGDGTVAEGAFVTSEVIQALFNIPAKQARSVFTKLELPTHPDKSEREIWYNERYSNYMCDLEVLNNVQDDTIWYDDKHLTNKLVPIGFTPKAIPVEGDKVKHDFFSPEYCKNSNIGTLIKELGVTTAPSIISISQLSSERLEELPTLNGKKSLMAEQMAHYNDILNWTDIQADVMQVARRILMPQYIENYGKHHRVLTELEVINGLFVNARSPLYEGLESLDMDTSAGFYAKTFLHKTKKREIFTLSEDKTPNGGYLYKWGKHEASLEMAGFVRDIENYATEGIRLFTLAQDNLKREVTKIGKTRMFESMDLPEVMLIRKWYGTFMAQVKLKHNVMHCQLGIDPLIEFDDLYRRFLKVSNMGEAGDFKRWDKHMMAPMVRLSMDTIRDIILHSLHPNYHSSFKNVHEVVVDMIINTYIIAGNIVYYKVTGNPSGNVLTTPLNSITNDLYHVGYLVWVSRKARQLFHSPSEFETFFDIKPSSTQVGFWKSETKVLEKLMSVTEWFNYGDDHVAAVSIEYAWLINFKLKQRYFMEMFNILYDTPEKDGKTYTLKPLYELSFLSRTFTVTKGGLVMPKLKKDSIVSLLRWARTSNISIQYQSFNDAINEAALHDKVFYDQVVKIVRAIHEYNNTSISLPTIYEYHVVRKHIKEEIRFGRSKISSFIRKDE